MTTNETFFFRDRVPFDNFRKFVLPDSSRSEKGHRPHPDLVRRLLDAAKSPIRSP